MIWRRGVPGETDATQLAPTGRSVRVTAEVETDLTCWKRQLAEMEEEVCEVGRHPAWAA